MGACGGKGSKGEPFSLDELSVMPHTVTMRSAAPKSRYLIDMPPEARSQFIAKLYVVAAAQAIVSATVSFPVAMLCSHAWVMQHLWLYYLAMFGLIAFFVGTPMLFERSVRIQPVGLIFLAVLALLAGLAAGLCSAAFAMPWLTIAVGCCVVGLSGLATFVLMTGSDFTSITPYIFATCFGMAVLGVVLICTDSDPIQAMLGGVLATLVSLFSVYEAKAMVSGQHRNYQFSIDDFVFGVASLHLDVVNMFTDLLGIRVSRL